MRLPRISASLVIGVLIQFPGTVLAESSIPAAPTAGETDASTISIDGETLTSQDGSTETTFRLPSGTVITTVTPPTGFDPLKADAKALARYGFPLPPSDAEDYNVWYAAMAAYKSNEPPSESMRYSPDAARYGTIYDIWGGYSAGTLNVQNHTFVAVKGNLTVPTNSGTCSVTNGVGFWIGLGGTGGTYAPNNLVQQGIGCGNPGLGTGSAYRPWMEFANTDPPVPFCGYSWTVAAGHVIYQNMSFQTSTNKAFFYFEDQTSGVTHSCSATPPPGWHWDLNTAEWIGEAPAGNPVDFDSVRFTNARAQLYSNSTWVTLGSQSVTQWIQGEGQVGGHLYACIDPGVISSGTSFYDYRVSSVCGP